MAVAVRSGKTVKREWTLWLVSGPLTRNWEAAYVAAFALVAVAARVFAIDRYTGAYSEGVRAEQLLLMAAGFRPFRDIFSDQGPWLLQVFYPGYVLFGGSLVGVRAASILGSLVGLGGLYWVVRQLSGPLGGVAALGLLAASPLYLYLSRLAVAETVALAPALLALGCALRFRGVRGGRWLYASAILFGLSLLVKPIAVGMLLPITLAVWGVRERRWRSLVVLGAVTAAVVLVGVLVVGPQEILQQIVQFRLASRRDAGWRLGTNAAQIGAQLAEEGPLLLALAAVGIVAVVSRRAAWPLLVWAGVGALTLLGHAPLHTKHIVILLMPLAGLAAFGLASLLTIGLKPLSRYGSLSQASLAVVLLIGVLGSIPALARDWWLLTTQDSSERDRSFAWYADGAETLRRAVAPDEYLVTDHAYLAYAANRLVPPPLVEASATRVHAGSLTDGLAIEVTERYRSRAVLLWASKLDDLRRYRTWVRENYAPVKVWAAENDTRPVLWVRADERLSAIRETLRDGLGQMQDGSEFGGWRLVSAGLDRRSARPGDPISATLEWERAGDATAEPQVQLVAVDSSGRILDDEREALLAGAGATRWLFWVGSISAPRAAGGADVVVAAALLDSRGRPLGTPVPIGSVRVGDY